MLTDAQPITFYNFIKNETTVYRKVTLAQFIKVTLVRAIKKVTLAQFQIVVTVTKWGNHTTCEHGGWIEQKWILILSKTFSTKMKQKTETNTKLYGSKQTHVKW